MKPLSRLIKPSATVSAIVLFLVANLLFLEAFKHYKESTQEDFGALALLASANKPDVVFVGSSMVMYPLIALDEAFARSRWSGEPGRVEYVEHALTPLIGRHPQVNNVSYMGFMVSDDCFIVDNYLKEQKCPKAVVLLVAPRDFYDVGFESPAAGIAFRKLADFSHFADFCGIYLKRPGDYIDFAGERLIVTFALRSKIQDKVHDWVLPKWWEFQSKLIPIQSQTDQPESRLAKSIREYGHRYQGITFDAMDKQFVFLEELLDLCNQRHIKTIVVNAPLTEQNIKLLPPGLYGQYCERLREIVGDKHANCLDLSNSTSYTMKDFSDGVHLNAFGARKLVNQLLPEMAKAVQSP